MVGLQSHPASLGSCGGRRRRRRPCGHTLQQSPACPSTAAAAVPYSSSMAGWTMLSKCARGGGPLQRSELRAGSPAWHAAPCLTAVGSAALPRIPARCSVEGCPCCLQDTAGISLCAEVSAAGCAGLLSACARRRAPSSPPHPFL